MYGIKKERPPVREHQTDTTKTQGYYNNSPPESQEEFLEWTLYDRSLRAGKLDPKKWPHVKNGKEYKINILHPDLKPLYERYQRIVTGRCQYPMSDTQRFEFERMVFSVLTLFDKSKEEKIRMLTYEIESIPKSPFWVKLKTPQNWLEHER